MRCFILPFLFLTLMLSTLLFPAFSFPAFALAEDGVKDEALHDYTPPPMFGSDPYVAAPVSASRVDSVLYRAQGLPPLPPHRPDKLSVPKSYIERLLIEDAMAHDGLEDVLIKQDSHDIYQQINPQY